MESSCACCFALGQQINGNHNFLPTEVSGRSWTKILEVSSFPVHFKKFADDLISCMSMKLLNEWHCIENIASMVYDIAAAHICHLTDGCICVKPKLDKALLWCACRNTLVS